MPEGNKDQAFAHSKEGQPLSAWQPLDRHLEQVADLAGEFASVFGAASWGRLIGLWHDLGKYAPDFQRYIRGSSEAHIEGKTGRVNHSSAGGLLAVDRFGKAGRILAYPIVGHHAGLPDWQSESAPVSSLAYRLNAPELLAAAQAGNIPKNITEQARPSEKSKNAPELVELIDGEECTGRRVVHPPGLALDMRFA